MRSSDAMSARFDEVYQSLSEVQGWMSRCQAERLWAAAARTSDGNRIVEIGSYHGRSAILLAKAAPQGVQIVAIDPHGGNDRGPQQIHGAYEDGQADHETFIANLTNAGVRDRIHHVRERSQEATDAVPGTVEVCYIDGAHRLAPALADIRRWGAKVSPGGTLLIHDTFSSIGVTAALLFSLIPGGEFEYVGRSRSLAEYRRVDLSLGGRVRNGLRQFSQFGYFAKNVVYKVLIAARLTPVAKALGSDGTWPY